MFMKNVFVLSLIALLTGCATVGVPPVQNNIDKSRDYNASYDKVWSAIISVVAESNLNITTLEKSSGIVAISSVNYDSTWADEGTRGSVVGVPDEVTDRIATFNIFAKQQGTDKISVQVNSSFKMNIRCGNGSQAFPFTYRWQQAYSNGTLENIILDGVASRI